MHPLYTQANVLSEKVLAAAYEVLDQLGPGLLESIYQKCLAQELRLRGHKVELEREGTVHDKGTCFKDTLRADLIVDDLFVVEFESMEKPIRLGHRVQVLSYIRLLNLPLGLVFNFGTCPTERAKRVEPMNPNHFSAGGRAA